MAPIEEQGQPTHKQLLARRTAVKGWVTRCNQKLTDVLAEADINVTKLNDAMEQFDTMLAKLDYAQTEVECSIEVEEDLLADVNEAADYRESVREIRVLASEQLRLLCSPAAPAASSSSHSLSPEVKLPKINIPSFGGDILQWESFWDIFSATVHDTDISIVTKFSYLKSSLEGEAAQAIQGLSLTVGNYETAVHILKERYGRKERLIFTHINSLLSITVPSKCALSSLKTLNDTLKGHTRSLENLGINSAQYGVILTPLVLSRLPQDIRLEWSREAEGKESDLTFLLDFLKKEIVRRERSQVMKDSLSQPTGPPAEEKRNKLPTASALQASSSPRPKSAVSTCAVCEKGHATERCYKLTRVTIDERRSIVQTAGLCFRCLRSGHIARGCSSTCAKCNGRHHHLFCNGASTSLPSNQTKHSSSAVTVSLEPTDTSLPARTTVAHDSNKPPGCSLSSRSNSPRILLQTARVTVLGSRGTAEATVLFDTGSDRSYVSSNLVQRVGPEWCRREPLSYAAFGAGKPSSNQMHNMYSCLLQDRRGSSHSLLVTEVPVICAPLCRPEIPPDILERLGCVELADDYSVGEEVQIDMLIGLDAYWRFVEPSSVNLVAPGFVAQATVFGQILSGCVPGTDATSSLVSHRLVCLQVSDSTVRSFWELESVGILPDEEDKDPLLTKFQDNLQKSDGRYETSLLWKPGMEKHLLNNERLAKIRLEQTSKRLSRDPVVKDMFDEALEEMLVSDVIEEVPPDELHISCPVYYMPCRPYVRESAVSTKCRPVYDASSKGFNGVSLNDCMEVGPCLLGNLTEILLRFRKWKIAITADIQKAFLQIAICPRDRDVHRFLWERNGTVRVMRFKRVPFGNCQSPFLLNATLRSHLESYPESEVAERLKDDIYMDDFLSGQDSVSDSIHLVEESSRIMAEASMTFAKWSSNNPEVGELLLREFTDKCLDSEAIKVLGMVWLARVDCFTFQGPSFPPGLKVTKRVIISFYSQLFDPLGFAAPFVMAAKCLFQEIWSLCLTWDQEVPPDLQVRFLRWVDGLDFLREWRIPRSYTPMGWSSIVDLTLHGFGDAAPSGYGACIYIVAHLEDGTCVSSLVIAKAKVAPLKSKTLPRLELLACLLCARLLQFVKKALGLLDEVSYTCWTDSMIALSWIQSHPSRWKQFVANRVSEIHQLTSADHWRHCPGSENPADLLTRGVSAEELVNSKVWLHGPLLMHDEVVAGDIEVKAFTDTELACEQKNMHSVLLSSVECAERVFEVERWGSLFKAIRIVGWVFRFIRNLKLSLSLRHKGALSLDELQTGKIQLIKDVQRHAFPADLKALRQGLSIPKGSSLFKLCPFLATDGLLRVQGRLQFSALSYSEKHPIILPRDHLALLFTRFHHILMKHAGVNAMLTSLRNEFWMIGARRTAKQVKKACMAC